MKTQNQSPTRSNCWKSIAGAVTILVLTAWTAHADQLFASINGTTANGGGSIFQYNPSGKQSTTLSSLDRPRGLAFDQTNNLFVATNSLNSTTGNLQGTIFKITPGGMISTFATGFPANFLLEKVVTDSCDNIFVVAANQNDPNLASTIFLITACGTVSTFGSTPGDSLDMAFDSAGNLFVADFGDQTIFKFTPAGVRSIFVGPPTFTAVQRPEGLAFDKSGNLFVSTGGTDGNDAILKLTPAGVVSTFATGLSQIPRGMAFSANGNLFVAEIGNTAPAAPGDILEFTPAGARTVFASGLGRPQGNGGAEFLTLK
jgi:DNA-binding beta-propeller fold protein YncE